MRRMSDMIILVFALLALAAGFTLLGFFIKARAPTGPVPSPPGRTFHPQLVPNATTTTGDATT